MTDMQRVVLGEAWRGLTAQMARLLGDRRRNIVEIELSELARVVELAELGEASRELTAALTAWSHEPVARRFERLAKYAVRLARRLGKGDIDIGIADDGIRLDTSRWAGFWSAMVHAVRNAVDHGIDDPEVRAAAGKPARPNLRFTASRTSDWLMISISDDGGGIDWDAVRERARACGLPAESASDLEQALFADGFSTRDRGDRHLRPRRRDGGATGRRDRARRNDRARVTAGGGDHAAVPVPRARHAAHAAPAGAPRQPRLTPEQPILGSRVRRATPGVSDDTQPPRSGEGSPQSR